MLMKFQTFYTKTSAYLTTLLSFIFGCLNNIKVKLKFKKK